jgi:hypothetical protein
VTDRRNADYGALVPELRLWDNGAGIDIDTWIACVCTPEQAIGYGRLFWPAFVSHDGCVFRANMFDLKNYSNWMGQLKGDRRAVQAVMNHLHLGTFLADEGHDPTHEQVMYLGNLLKETWSAKLGLDYPGQAVMVTFAGGEAADLRAYELTFWTDGAREGAV